MSNPKKPDKKAKATPKAKAIKKPLMVPKKKVISKKPTCTTCTKSSVKSGTIPRKGGPGGRNTDVSKHPAFIERLATTHDVGAACVASGLPWRTAYYHRQTITSFAADWEEALKRACQAAHGELYQRGVVGWDEPVYQGGEEVGTIRRKSDKCLGKFLEHNMPEIYSTKSLVELKGKIELTDEDVVVRGRAATAGILSALAASVKGTKA
jgi:hypothetical protein